MSTNLRPQRPNDDALEAALRSAFGHGADTVGATTDPWARTTRAVARSRARRRATAVSLAAAVALVGVAGTVGLPGLDRLDGAPADRSTQTTLDDVRVLAEDISTWPVRGERADDDAFLADVRTALAGRGTVAAVLFAGRLGGRDVAVGVVDVDLGDGQRSRTLEAVLPQAGTSAAQWRVETGYPVEGLSRVSFVLQREDGTADLLVLARSDAEVAFSARPAYDAQGTVSRAFVGLPTVGGVARVELEAVPVAGVSIRTASPVGLRVDGAELVVSDWEPVTMPQSAFGWVGQGWCAGAVTVQDAMSAVNGVVQNRGGQERPTAVEPLWCRRIEGGWAVGLVGVRLADGTAVQVPVRVETREDGGAFLTSTGVVVPRDALTTAPLVASVPTAPDGVQRFAVNAPGVASVDLAREVGPAPLVLATATPDAEGYALLAATEAEMMAGGVGEVVVVLRDASGAEVGRLPVDQVDDDGLAVRLDGPVTYPSR